MMEPNFSIKTEVDKAGYGLFVMEPLEQGYGQTLGNSLRRVLLTWLPGHAIVSVKIAGISHQYSTILGLKEDVVELLLNLKKVRLTVEGEGPSSLTLKKKGPGEVVAGDFEPSGGVTIVNPTLVLGTLADKKSELEITAVVARGFGYVTADEKNIDEIGVIPLDALYSPVVRVNYRVEATRVGRMTNLDRLVMEVWTDGSIAPLAALQSAAKTLVSYISGVYEPKVSVAKDDTAIAPSVSDEMLKMRIEELDIPTRIVNALAHGSIETISQLLATPKADLIKIKNLGSKSLSIVEEKLREKGVVLTA